MLGQTDRDGIPAALPRGIAVANKTGELDGTRNDIAIVEPFGDSPFVLAIMTADAYDYAASYAAIHAVTRATYAVAARSYEYALDASVDPAAVGLAAPQRRELRRARQSLKRASCDFAAANVGGCHHATSATGSRPRVYFAPLRRPCAATRRTRSSSRRCRACRPCSAARRPPPSCRRPVLHGRQELRPAAYKLTA